MVLQTADGESDHFDLAFAELAAQSCSSAQLGGADRCVVSGVGEQDSPPRMKTTSEAVPRVRQSFQSDTTFLFKRRTNTS